MADAMDSDTCVGFKRTIEETQALPQSPNSPSAISDCHSSEVVSPLKHASDFVDNSSDTVKKVKLLPEEIQEMPNSLIGKSESCEVGFVSSDGELMKTDETLHDKKERVASDLGIGEVGLVSGGEFVRTGDCLDDEKERVAPDLAAMGEVGLAGQEKLVQGPNSANESEYSEGLLTSGESKVLFHGKEAESESCLELKKKQLLEEVESILVPAKKTHLQSTFKIEVIDDTALIETVSVAKSGAKCAAQRKGNKNARQEMNGKKETISGRKEKVGSHVVEPPSLRFKNREKGMKMVYSRMELEAMRFMNVAEQNNLWKDIYRGLGPVVAKEYDNMACAKHEKNIPNNYGPRKRFEKMEVVPALRGEAFSENEGIELENLVNNGTQDASSLDPFFRYSANDEDEGSEDDDSDEDYASIQRPAFAVEGEPNFDSGSPEDGLEYLRRVRWEAAKIPKVRVAKIDRSKFNSEQSAYMPKIPEIAKCPEQLLPLKLWEDAFLTDFSELRLAVSRFEGSTASPPQDPHQKPEQIFFETFANVKSKEIDFHWPHDGSILGSFIDKLSLSTPEGSNVSHPAESISPTSTSTVSENSSDYPLMSVILRMDSVARVSMLRKRIKAVEDMSTLSRRDCLWLFALCAVVDTPLDADASASLRSLLRKCAALRATKSILDDEVVMLNILAIISGRYFGQSEN